MPERISETGPLTAVHLAIVAALIVLVILAMIWGARLKRKRVAADKVEEHRLEEAGAARPQAKRAHRPHDKTADEPSPPIEPARDASPAAAPSAAQSPPTAPPIAAPSEPATDTRTSRLADEPVAAASGLEAAPTSEAEPAPAASGANDGAAPVTQLKGLGPKVAARLGELGITRIGQLAALDATQAADLDAQLGSFKGRMERDRWIEQAQLLAAGDRAGFEAKFGKL